MDTETNVEQVDLIMPSAREKLMTKVKEQKKRTEARRKENKKQELEERHKRYFSESFEKLSSKWFLIDPNSVSHDEAKILEKLVYHKARNHILIWFIFYFLVLGVGYITTGRGIMSEYSNDFKCLKFLIGKRARDKRFKKLEEKNGN